MNAPRSGCPINLTLEALGAKLVPKHRDTPWSKMICAITNPRLLLLIRSAVCPEVGLRRDSSSAGSETLFTGSILRPSYTMFCLTAMATALMRSFV